MVKDQEYLEKKASYCLDLAKKFGATDSNVKVGSSISETVNFRNKKLENITTILRSIKNEIKKNYTFVGDDFVNQARSMNQGQIKEKSIYGHGTKKEIDELRDEGVDVLNIPWITEDH